MAVTLSVCTSCAGGAELSAALAPHFRVNEVACMNLCVRPPSMSVRAEGKYAYLFGDVRPEMVEDIKALMKLYEADKMGAIDDARPLGELRFCLVGRVPY